MHVSMAHVKQFPVQEQIVVLHAVARIHGEEQIITVGQQVRENVTPIMPRVLVGQHQFIKMRGRVFHSWGRVSNAAIPMVQAVEIPAQEGINAADVLLADLVHQTDNFVKIKYLVVALPKSPQFTNALITNGL